MCLLLFIFLFNKVYTNQNNTSILTLIGLYVRLFCGCSCTFLPVCKCLCVCVCVCVCKCVFECVCVCLLQYQSMRLSDVHRKAQLWRGIVSISLIEGRSLQPMDNNGLSDPYVKFRMGHQKYKSKVNTVVKSFFLIWLLPPCHFVIRHFILNVSRKKGKLYEIW